MEKRRYVAKIRRGGTGEIEKVLPEKLRNLRYEEFTVPDKVLLYGGGGLFKGVAPYMLACGISLAGIIDTKKSGTEKIGGREVPYYSIQRAWETFGAQALIVITIADEAVLGKVRQDLVQTGFLDERIFDFNVWTYLTRPSEKSYCPYLGGYLQFMQCGLSACCNTGVVDAYLCEWFAAGRPIEKSVENFLEKRLYYLEEAKKGRIPLYCWNCSFLSSEKPAEDVKISQFIISDHAFCNADCVYCSDACSVSRPSVGWDAAERYEAIVQTLENLRQRDLLDKRALVQLAGGEITIHPYKKQLYEAAKKFPHLEIQIFSNCFLYDEEIADLLSRNSRSFLQCDLDAGTPETYIKVKGFHKFYVVKENLKKYAQHGNVKLKYLVLPGWNDTDADYEGTVELLRDLGLTELQLSPESRASRENDRFVIREILFAVARFMKALEENGIQVILSDVFWQKQHKAIAKRLCRELQALHSQKNNET